MEVITLQVEKREETGRKVRMNENIPAVVYGHGFETQSLWVDPTLFKRAFDQAGTSSIIDLVVGKDKAVKALIHDFQSDAISNEFSHIDFFHVRMDEKVETHIPILVVGESAAIKNLGGVLNQLESITVRALPGDLVHEITVDISKIETFEDRITIADLGLGDKIEVLTDIDTPVATVSAPRIMKEETEDAPETEETEEEAPTEETKEA